MLRGTIRFSLRLDKQLTDGTAPIHLVYQTRSCKNLFAIPHMRLMPENWNQKEQKAVFINSKKRADLLTKAETDKINYTLLSYKGDITRIEDDLINENKEFSAKMVVERLKDLRKPTTIKNETKQEAARLYLLDFMQNFINDNSETKKKGSLDVYNSVVKNLRDFQTDTGKKIKFETIDYAFLQAFQNYLIRTKKLNNTTIAKRLSTVKTFINKAKLYGYTVTDQYKDFKIKRESLEVIALTNNEFESLYKLNISNKKLQQVKDVFCFACVTGLRYSDLAQLKWEHITPDEIKIVVKKTSELLTIPLNKYSKEILSRYKNQDNPLPIISIQKLNVYIKDLCEKVGINTPTEKVRFSGAKRFAKPYPKYQLITIHTGRKTFATLSLEKGMSAEEVMEITGHKDYKSFKRYVKITEQRKKVVMRKCWDNEKIRLQAV